MCKNTSTYVLLNTHFKILKATKYSGEYLTEKEVGQTLLPRLDIRTVGGQNIAKFGMVLAMLHRHWLE